MALDLDAKVTRVTDGKKAGLMPLRELEIGDKFTHDGKLYELKTVRTPLGSCENGIRVKYGSRWYFVNDHGHERILLPCEEHENPFSALAGQTSESALPLPSERVDALTFEELTSEPVAV